MEGDDQSFWFCCCSFCSIDHLSFDVSYLLEVEQGVFKIVDGIWQDVGFVRF